MLVAPSRTALLGLCLLAACGSGQISPTGPRTSSLDAASSGEGSSDGDITPPRPDLAGDRPFGADVGFSPEASSFDLPSNPPDVAASNPDLAPWTGNPCPAGTPCAILPLGDSITFGYGSSGGGYRVPLFHLALAAHQSITFVGSMANGPPTVDGVPFPPQHEGHSGRVIFDIDVIAVNVMTTYKPRIVLLMIGTNDIAAGFDRPNAPARVGGLIDKLTATAPDALVVVATIVPNGNAGGNGLIQTFNAGVRTVVETRAAAGKHVVLVDMFGAFTANPQYATALMFDGLHPNDAGYSVMANVWYKAIAGFLH